MQTNNLQKAQSEAFTGHRFISYEKYLALKALLEQSIKTFYAQGIYNFYCGMLCKALHSKYFIKSIDSKSKGKG